MDVSKRWPVWPEAVGRELDPTVQSFKDILDGLAVLYENPFIRDIRDTILAYPDSALGIALNKKQTACKKWLVEELYQACGSDLGLNPYPGGLVRAFGSDAARRYTAEN